MTDHRSNSRERNAPKATFGNTSRNRFDRSKSPGPSEYNTAKRNIGDESGHHVVFAAQMRPCSAKAGTIRQEMRPGPQDYTPVDSDVFLKRSNVIPKFRFPVYDQAKQESISNRRSKSPGPQQYRP